MLTCYGCASSVHLYCYGINTPYNIEKSQEMGREVYMFVCIKCKEKGPDFQPVILIFYLIILLFISLLFFGVFFMSVFSIFLYFLRVLYVFS